MIHSLPSLFVLLLLVMFSTDTISVSMVSDMLLSSAERMVTVFRPIVGEDQVENSNQEEDIVSRTKVYTEFWTCVR